MLLTARASGDVQLFEETLRRVLNDAFAGGSEEVAYLVLAQAALNAIALQALAGLWRQAQDPFDPPGEDEALAACLQRLNGVVEEQGWAF